MLRIWKWVRENIGKAIVLAAATASLTGWFRVTFDTILREYLPSGAKISCIGREWIVDHSPFRQAEPSKEVFRILVATLDHDDANRTLTEAVVRAFQGEKGIEAVETCRVLTIEGGGERIEEAAVTRGHGWLSRRDADVLVFGEWIGNGEALNLHFLPVRGRGDFRQHAFKLESGLLKVDFSEALGAQLRAVALAAVRPTSEESGKYLVQTLRPLAGRLEQLIRFPPTGLSAGQLADVQFALGLALNTIGDQAGDNESLSEAVAAYREASKERTRERVPLEWAITQMNLGNALTTLGAWEGGTGKLEEAVAANRAALEILTRERVPLEWAKTQTNLGNALSTLGESENGTGKLEEAVAAYRAALEIFTRERVPLEWATTQMNLGIALRALGSQENGTGKLEEAVAAYRAALEIFTRELTPLRWATTQMNLGNALSTLGERENGTGKLEEAVAAYREALKELTRESAPHLYDIMQRNLARCLALLEQPKL